MIVISTIRAVEVDFHHPYNSVLILDLNYPEELFAYICTEARKAHGMAI